MEQITNRAEQSRPTFIKRTIENNRDDGYWIEGFKPDPNKPTELVAYGLTDGEIKRYQNLDGITNPVKIRTITKLTNPVAMDQADITGNGLNDIIICFDYGRTMVDCNPSGGKIVWLENPGFDVDDHQWKSHYVGKSIAMHRLTIGHFTQKERWEIIGLPIVGKQCDVHSPVSLSLFQQPDDLLNASEWNHRIIDLPPFHIIHEVKRFNQGGLDHLLIASCEGINWVYFDENDRKWILKHIGDGEYRTKQQTGYYGSGCIDIGKTKGDRFAYLPAVEPFHGNVVAVYVKSFDQASDEIKWNRYVLDVFGTPNENGEGPAHHVVCADFDNDGTDEFLVALRGPAPHQGVYLYKPIDLAQGSFSKWMVSDESAARIAVADFDHDGYLDFATISYDVPGYYMSQNPSVNLFYNRSLRHQQLQVIRKNDELIFNVSRPDNASSYQSLPIISMNGIRMSLEIMPKQSSRLIDDFTHVKVLFGTVEWNERGENTSQIIKRQRGAFCEPKSTSPLSISGVDGRIKAGDQGAILLTFRTPTSIDNIPRIDDIRKIVIEKLLPCDYQTELHEVNFEFVRCDQYEWGQKFKDVEFYNMKGFEIRFIETDEKLCYVQMWAAGLGTNCGVHNHEKDLFCEIHACLINGSGAGGMHYLRDVDASYDSATTKNSEFEELIVPSLHEHGPLWKMDSESKPFLRNDGTVIYPYHKWQSGNSELFEQSFDLWVAFEYNIKLSNYV